MQILDMHQRCSKTWQISNSPRSRGNGFPIPREEVLLRSFGVTLAQDVCSAYPRQGASTALYATQYRHFKKGMYRFVTSKPNLTYYLLSMKFLRRSFRERIVIGEPPGHRVLSTSLMAPLLRTWPSESSPRSQPMPFIAIDVNQQLCSSIPCPYNIANAISRHSSTTLLIVSASITPFPSTMSRITLIHLSNLA